MELKPSSKRNSNGVKSSCNCYRNINGVHYEQWTHIVEDFEKEKAEAKKLGLKTRIIQGELYREVKQDVQ